MRSVDTIRADLDAARARFAGTDRLRDNFPLGVGCGRSRRSIDKGIEATIDAAKRISALEAELRAVERRAERAAAGTAAEQRAAKIAASDFAVGQMVRTLYGVNKVVRVNAKSISVEAMGGGSINVPKHLARAA